MKDHSERLATTVLKVSIVLPLPNYMANQFAIPFKCKFIRTAARTRKHLDLKTLPIPVAGKKIDQCDSRSYKHEQIFCEMTPMC